MVPTTAGKGSGLHRRAESPAGSARRRKPAVDAKNERLRHRALPPSELSLRHFVRARLIGIALIVWSFIVYAAGRDTAVAAHAQPRPFTDLHWRMIGPFRGGRTVAVSGVPGQPGVFYMAPTDGGVWKSVDYGRVWNPIFDGQPSGSVGALAVAPSDANVVYVGSGEGLRRPDLSTGDGMYRSADAGRTWIHQGLRDGQQIAAIAVDPRDANRLYVAVAGHPFGPNAERGLYRSVDGGRSYAKILGSGVDQGAVTVVIDPNHPDVVYAALWAARNGPWNLVKVYERYDRNGLYKSIDGGTTWRRLNNGLPAAVGRIGISVAATDSNRLYVLAEEPGDRCGIYRSSDGGASFRATNHEERVCGRADDFAGITADPANRDIVYSANTSAYRSNDAGSTWTPIKGAPGGDDYHTIWIDPHDSRIMLLGVDQGATLTTDGGRSWSSWYNQPTAQFYHVITDDRFPYRVFGAQQESGSAEVSSRGNDGAITFREFHPVGVEEYGYVAPDPLHPWLIYGGKASVYDEHTGQTRDIAPTYDRRAFRFDRTNPLIWNRVDRRTLYLGLNVVFATRDGGQRWHVISPDLTRTRPGQPATLATFNADDPQSGRHRGVIYSLAPAYRDARALWAGTDDGLVWLTRDGGDHWRNVTPPGIGPWDRVTQIDASHFERGTAYVAVSRQRLDDLRPLLYRTRDFGRTWRPIAVGIPANEPVNTVREDPQRRGLLFAGTERTVYVSFDDGGEWQPLQSNLPATSIRDLVVHGDDLVIATHGRSFWILDDITPLRRASTMPVGVVRGYVPSLAYRVRSNTNTDTPLPPEEPAAQNPPDGVVIDYTLGPAAGGPVTIAISDAAGKRIRTFASTDAPAPIDPEINVPTYWIRSAAGPPATAGDHRFVWDLHERSPQAVSHGYPIAAIAHDTPRVPRGVLVEPGRYHVRISTMGRSVTQIVTVRMDPRVRTSLSDLHAQHAIGIRIVAGLDRSYDLFTRARATGRQTLAQRYARVNDELSAMLDATQSADAAPTEAQRRAVARLLSALRPRD